jgi:hypothetical protein
VERQPIESSSLRSVGHDFESQILEVEFVNGRTYRYFNVAADAYLALLEAPSKGAFFNAHIKDRYPSQRLG